MKRMVLAVLAAMVVGAGLYATTAPASQQAVTPKQLAALQKRVKDLEGVVNFCFQGGMPVTSYNGYVAIATDGSAIQTTALDVTDQGDQPVAYVLDVGQGCADAINRTFGARHFKTLRPTATTRH